MSAVVSAIIVLQAPRSAVLKAAADLDLPVWVSPTQRAVNDATVLFPKGDAGKISAALGVHLGKAMSVAIESRGDKDVVVWVRKGSVAVETLKAGTSTTTGVARIAAALALGNAKVATGMKDDLLGALYHLLQLDRELLALAFAGVTQSVAKKPQRFVGFTYVHDALTRELTPAVMNMDGLAALFGGGKDDADEDDADEDDADEDDADEDDADEDDADEDDADEDDARAPIGKLQQPLRSLRAAGSVTVSSPDPRRLPRATAETGPAASADLAASLKGPPGERLTGKKGQRRLNMAASEAAALTDSFREARVEREAPKAVAGAESQLANAANASEWLAIRRAIDPTRVTSEIMQELAAVVRHGRFQNEGDKATVVREAAAMLLGRALKSQANAAALFASLRGTPGSAAEAACWEIVQRMAELGGKNSKS